MTFTSHLSRGQNLDQILQQECGSTLWRLIWVCYTGCAPGRMSVCQIWSLQMESKRGGSSLPAEGFDEDVLRFEVTVDEIQGVHEGQAPKHLPHQTHFDIWCNK